MSDDAIAVWEDRLSNGLTVRRYPNGDVRLQFSDEVHKTVLLDDESIEPMLQFIREVNLDRPVDVLLSETRYGTERIRGFNGVLLIVGELSTMPISHTLAREVADCIEENGRFGTPETACDPDQHAS